MTPGDFVRRPVRDAPHPGPLPRAGRGSSRGGAVATRAPRREQRKRAGQTYLDAPGGCGVWTGPWNGEKPTCLEAERPGGAEHVTARSPAEVRAREGPGEAGKTGRERCRRPRIDRRAQERRVR